MISTGFEGGWPGKMWLKGLCGEVEEREQDDDDDEIVPCPVPGVPAIWCGRGLVLGEDDMEPHRRAGVEPPPSGLQEQETSMHAGCHSRRTR